MSEKEVRKKIIEVIANEIDSFDRFKIKAEKEIPSLPENLQSIAKIAIKNEDFKKQYPSIIKAYEAVAKDPEISMVTTDELYSDTVIQKVESNLKTRGIKVDYKSDGKRKEFHLKIDSSFLKALGALISKISGLF